MEGLERRTCHKSRVKESKFDLQSVRESGWRMRLRYKGGVHQNLVSKKRFAMTSNTIWITYVIVITSITEITSGTRSGFVTCAGIRCLTLMLIQIQVSKFHWHRGRTG